MQRIIKRFLLHKQRETDEVNEFSFEELKQDMQMIRFEINHDVKKTREEIMHMLGHLDKSMTLVSDAVLGNGLRSPASRLKRSTSKLAFDRNRIDSVRAELRRGQKEAVKSVSFANPADSDMISKEEDTAVDSDDEEKATHNEIF